MPSRRRVRGRLDGEPDGSTGNFSTVTYFYYDGWELIEEHDASATLLARYIHGAREDELIAKIDSYGTVYYHTDAEGSVAALTNSSGNVIERYKYDAFGKATILDPSSLVTRPSSLFGNRFLFTGREWLPDLGLYDYRNRVYSPELGRFLQTDPKSFDADPSNLYRYCGNDSLDRTDPMGLQDESSSGYVNQFYRQSEHMSATEILSMWDRLERSMPLTMGQTAAINEQKAMGEAAARDREGVQATQRCMDKMGDAKAGVPRSQVVLINSKGEKVYSDIVAGEKHGKGFTESIPLGPDYFEAFRSGAQKWDPKKWSVYVIGHTHPDEKSADPRMSGKDRSISRKENAPVYKNHFNSSTIFDKFFNGRETRLKIDRGNIKDVGPDPDWQ